MIISQACCAGPKWQENNYSWSFMFSHFRAAVGNIWTQCSLSRLVGARLPLNPQVEPQQKGLVVLQNLSPRRGSSIWLEHCQDPGIFLLEREEHPRLQWHLTSAVRTHCHYFPPYPRVCHRASLTLVAMSALVLNIMRQELRVEPERAQCFVLNAVVKRFYLQSHSLKILSLC